VVSLWEIAGLAVVASAIGAVGGLGGAVLLVPALVLAGLDPEAAAPLGLLAVAAGSLAASPTHLEQGLVHHRLGLTLEVAGGSFAVLGALVSEAVSDTALTWVLVVTALVAAVAGGFRQGLRNRPMSAFSAEPPGEWPGTLGGAYSRDGHVVPYRARRLLGGLGLVSAAGAVAGLAGVGGGFLKTPAMSEVMHVPVKVAAATSTFTVGITAVAGLAVFAGQGRIDLVPGASAVVGAMVGGAVGARLQDRLSPVATRRFLAIVLVAVAAALIVQV